MRPLSTNLIERLNKEVKRRSEAVGNFPSEASINWLIGKELFEQNGEWQTASRYMQVDEFANVDAKESGSMLSIKAARSCRLRPPTSKPT